MKSLLFAITLTLLAASGSGLRAETESEVRVQLGGPFELVDQFGATRHDSDFLGQYMLVYFGYIWCPDVCPAGLWNITLALEKLGERAKRVQPIFITVDPERDTVADMRRYAEHFHPSLVALTGNTLDIMSVADSYLVKYRKSGNVDGDDYMVDHSAYMYLMDPSGDFVRFFSHEAQSDEIATGIGEILEQER